MNAEWFKARKKQAGVTDADIAAIVGRDRSAVPKILSGQQGMTMPWAKAFSQALGVSLREVLRNAGAIDDGPALPFRHGFAESDVEPFQKDQPTLRAKALADALGAGRSGVDQWRVTSNALALVGFRKGDHILVDQHAADRVRAGDVVIAQVYDVQSGDATTVLREYRPPVLVPASADPDERRVHVVDGSNVMIRGRVVASWRELA